MSTAGISGSKNRKIPRKPVRVQTRMADETATTQKFLSAEVQNITKKPIWNESKHMFFRVMASSLSLNIAIIYVWWWWWTTRCTAHGHTELPNGGPDKQILPIKEQQPCFVRRTPVDISSIAAAIIHYNKAKGTLRTSSLAKKFHI